MAQNSWPFETLDTSETQYSQLFNYFQDDGIAGNPGVAGTINVELTGGLGVQVTPGFAIIRGFAYQNTANVPLTLTTANAQPRIDVVVLRLDPSSNSIIAAVKTGTPGTNPSAPALTQTPGGVWEMGLVEIRVQANATSLGPTDVVADDRRFLGGTVGLWTNDSRPASPVLGRFGYNTSLGKFEWWNGTIWTTTLPVDITIADNAISNAMLAGSIADDKLVTPPGRYRSVVSQPAATAFTVSNNERGRLVTTGSGSGVTITINSGLVAGDRIDFIQEGTGQITFVAGSGVSLLSAQNRFKTKGQYSVATVVAVGANNLRLSGDLVV